MGAQNYLKDYPHFEINKYILCMKSELLKFTYVLFRSFIMKSNTIFVCLVKTVAYLCARKNNQKIFFKQNYISPQLNK